MLSLHNTVTPIPKRLLVFTASSGAIQCSKSQKHKAGTGNKSMKHLGVTDTTECRLAKIP